MGFFGELVDIFEDLCDIAEYATVGFVEEVIKGKDEYKTSYERKAEAKSIRSSADSRLNNASKSFNQSVEQLNNRIRELNVRKKRLLGKLSCVTSTIDCQLSMGHYVSGRDDSLDWTLNGTDPISVCIRISLADEDLEDAKDYRAECNTKVAQINNMKVRLEAVSNVLDEEERVLDILERSQNLARSAKSEKIAERLNNLLAMYVCDTDVEINREYVQSVKILESLCNGI